MKMAAKRMNYPDLLAHWFGAVLGCHRKSWADLPDYLRDQDFNALIESIKANDDDETDDPVKIIQNVLGGMGLILSEFAAAHVRGGAIVVALTHCARSEFAWDRGDQAAAWSHLTLCSYWVSGAVNGMNVDGHQKKDRSRLASKGGRAKSSKLDPLKARARELFVHPPKGNITWASLGDAGRGILSDLEAYRSENHEDIPSVTAKTIAAWVSGFSEVNFMIRNKLNK